MQPPCTLMLETTKEMALLQTVWLVCQLDLIGIFKANDMKLGLSVLDLESFLRIGSMHI